MSATLIHDARIVYPGERIAAGRLLLNTAAAVCRGPKLPGPGEPLRSAAGLHLTVPPDQPGVLHDLLRAATAELRPSGLACLTLSLDAANPVTRAVPRFSFRTAIGVGLTTPSGRWRGPTLDGRPLQIETALV